MKRFYQMFLALMALTLFGAMNAGAQERIPFDAEHFTFHSYTGWDADAVESGVFEGAFLASISIYLKLKFLDWFEHTRPDIDAGWVSTYDKWLYETKGIVPDLSHYLEEDANPYDYHFIEVVNPWDSSAWLYNFIKNQSNAAPEDYIVYYFDC